MRLQWLSGPITKISQSDRSIAGPIFLSIGPDKPFLGAPGHQLVTIWRMQTILKVLCKNKNTVLFEYDFDDGENPNFDLNITLPNKTDEDCQFQLMYSPKWKRRKEWQPGDWIFYYSPQQSEETMSDLRTLKFLSLSINKTREPESVPPNDLDKLLSKCFKDVCKETGGEHEPSTLTSFQCSFQRHFSEKKLPCNKTKNLSVHVPFW